MTEWRLILSCYGEGCSDHSHAWYLYATLEGALRRAKRELVETACCDNMEVMIVEVTV